MAELNLALEAAVLAALMVALETVVAATVMASKVMTETRAVRAVKRTIS